MARTLKPTPYHIEAEAARAKAEAAAAKAKAPPFFGASLSSSLDPPPAKASSLAQKRKAELDEKKKQARKQRKTEADEKKKHDPRANHALQEATTAWLMDAWIDQRAQRAVSDGSLHSESETPSSLEDRAMPRRPKGPSGLIDAEQTQGD